MVTVVGGHNILARPDHAPIEVIGFRNYLLRFPISHTTIVSVP